MKAAKELFVTLALQVKRSLLIDTTEKADREPDGRLYADSDGCWYYITKILENGNERRLLSSNALSHVQESAQRFSTGAKGWSLDLDSLLIINGKTHTAIAFYARGTGLQDDWREDDQRKAAVRKEAYESGNSLINYLR
jgi:hypothetical protein